MLRGSRGTIRGRQKTETHMPNDQDRLFKELIAKTLPELLSLKSELTPIPNSTLSPEVAVTFERRADYLCKAVDAKGDEWIIHIEFQARREADMAYRMREYHFYISKKYKLPVFPIVLLIGQEGPEMSTLIPSVEVYHGFHLLELGKIKLDFFQQSDTPEIVAMGILSDFNGMPPEEVVSKLIDRIVETSPWAQEYSAPAVEAILEGGDALVVMPTGSGKSLCYQLPGLVDGGTTLVVSPLIALMKDQVDALQAKGIPAAAINSSMPAAAQREVMQQMRDGTLKLVYVAPERLRHRGFMNALRETTVALLAVDEAHCVSQWGHDFRPDYLAIGDARERMGRDPIVELLILDLDLPGDRGGDLGVNHPRFIETMLSAWTLGAVFVPLNFRLTAPELEFIINDAGVHTLVVDDALRPVVGPARDALVCRNFVASESDESGWHHIDTLIANGAPVAEHTIAGQHDTAVIMYTSGTTGRPKGAMLTHGNMTWNNIGASHNISVEYHKKNIYTYIYIYIYTIYISA